MKTLQQKIIFKNTTPKILYDLYMDSKKHTLATGAPAKMTTKEGGEFSVHDGYIKGKNLQLIKNKLIVQSWRAREWNKEEIDSTFIINLEAKGNDTVLEMIHANIPIKHAPGIDKGWKDYYWEPWKKYLAGKKVTRKEGM